MELECSENCRIETGAFFFLLIFFRRVVESVIARDLYIIFLRPFFSVATTVFSSSPITNELCAITGVLMASFILRGRNIDEAFNFGILRIPTSLNTKFFFKITSQIKISSKLFRSAS